MRCMASGRSDCVVVRQHAVSGDKSVWNVGDIRGFGQCVPREGSVPHRLEDHAAMPLNRLSQDRIVTRESGLHRCAALLPARGAALDVGEEKRDGAGPDSP